MSASNITMSLVSASNIYYMALNTNNSIEFERTRIDTYNNTGVALIGLTRTAIAHTQSYSYNK